jgi:hypothetical protein
MVAQRRPRQGIAVRESCDHLGGSGLAIAGRAKKLGHKDRNWPPERVLLRLFSQRQVSLQHRVKITSETSGDRCFPLVPSVSTSRDRKPAYHPVKGP